MWILDTVVRWSKQGIYYEADQRHSEIVVCEMGLENAQTAPTAGTREEQKAASVPAQRVEVVEESRELGARFCLSWMPMHLPEHQWRRCKVGRTRAQNVVEHPSDSCAEQRGSRALRSD